ncbi:MAG TPA: hypothetical protein VI423_10905 [Paenisporosarcina sp.]|nr:hypothetical protein [Paenisporosarcina sp.]
MTTIRIGVVGYSGQKFDENEAQDLIAGTFDAIEMRWPDRKTHPGKRAVTLTEKVIVSGLTDVGIPALAYREAVRRGWKTVGIACEKAKEYDLFPVDKKIIVGKEWGDESETLLNNIDVLVRIGGGKQSLREVKQFQETGKPVIEHELEAK